jgi:tRNA(fMet)-specific endonuclease VapC
MYLLDTNICIYAIKQKSEKLLKKIHDCINSKIFISALTIAEMEFGITNSQFPEKNRMSLLKFISIFSILPFDDEDAIPYGIIKTSLKKSGLIIGPIDMLLAAQAVAKKLILVTNNTNEFSRVNGLLIEDWSL